MKDNHLRAALDLLGLPPGAGWSKILARYRQLIKLWHPDRFRIISDKQSAEELLKRFIAAKELLQSHYESADHRPNSYCICWGPPPDVQPTAPSDTSPPHTSQPDTSPSQAAKSAPQPPPAPAPATNGQGTMKPPQAKEKKTPWDWVNELCDYLDIGPINAAEPAWCETFRRFCDRALGKHPGETVMDVWEKPATWTKEHKRKCLLIALFTVMALDRIMAVIDPDGLKSPSQTANPPAQQEQKQDQKQDPKPTLPLAPFPDNTRPDLGPPVDFDSPEEKRKEWEYFDRKWQEKERMLESIRPGYKPPS